MRERGRACPVWKAGEISGEDPGFGCAGEGDGSGRWARPVSGVRVMRGEGSWQVGPTGEATRGDGLLRERGGGRPAAWAVGEVGVGRVLGPCWRVAWAGEVACGLGRPGREREK